MVGCRIGHGRVRCGMICSKGGWRGRLWLGCGNRHIYVLGFRRVVPVVDPLRWRRCCCYCR